MTKQEIIDRLHQIEAGNEVRILLAVESGSRAWGFASPDSDWDVRFIYVHPLAWYLTVELGRDTIEVMDGDFDAAGWDLRKALQLFRKTNPTMLEWLHSPIRYIDDGILAKALTALEPEYFNVTGGLHHYYSMAQKHDERYLSRDGVTLKRFLYYLRGLLACKWIAERKTPPPVLFRELVESTVKNKAIRDAIEGLLLKKSRSNEHNQDSVPPLLCDYAAKLSSETAAYLATQQPEPPTRAADKQLDQLLYNSARCTNVKTKHIDIHFDFTSDTPGYWEGFWERNNGLGSPGADPDAKSPRLNEYHRLLWSKRLPSGEILHSQTTWGVNTQMV